MLLFVLAAFIAVLVGAVSCRPALSRYAITPAKMYEGPGAIIWIGLLFGCYWLTIEATPGLNPYAQYIFTFVWAYFAAQFLAGIIERLTGRAGGQGPVGASDSSMPETATGPTIAPSGSALEADSSSHRLLTNRPPERPRLDR